MFHSLHTHLKLIDGVVSDGQQSIRKAVEVALPEIAHGLCHFHYLKEASKIISDGRPPLDASGLKLQERLTLIEQSLQKMSNEKHLLGSLSQGIEHFIKITTSYWSGLFHCYEIEDLPRTNNDLEQTFGVLRHHQRRCTGRKVAPSSLVIRGSVQLDKICCN